MPKNIKLIIEYDGSSYYGWQEQKGYPTVEAEIKKALYKIYKENIKLYAASRIDAKAHAMQQVVNFFVENNSIPIDKLPQALNSILPEDIIIKETAYVDNNFHARYSAIGRRYRYIIYNDTIPNVFYRHYAYFYPYKLDIENMERAAKELLGKKDFSKILKVPPKKSPIREIKDIKIEVEKVVASKTANIIKIDITADSFLYKMVKLIVGLLIGAGEGKFQPQQINLILSGKIKLPIKFPPACGLYLVEVYY